MCPSCDGDRRIGRGFRRTYSAPVERDPGLRRTLAGSSTRLGGPFSPRLGSRMEGLPPTIDRGNRRRRSTAVLGQLGGGPGRLPFRVRTSRLNLRLACHVCQLHPVPVPLSIQRAVSPSGGVSGTSQPVHASARHRLAELRARALKRHHLHLKWSKPWAPGQPHGVAHERPSLAAHPGVWGTVKSHRVDETLPPNGTINNAEVIHGWPAFADRCVEPGCARSVRRAATRPR